MAGLDAHEAQHESPSIPDRIASPSMFATGPGLRGLDLRPHPSHRRDGWLLGLLQECGYTEIGGIPIEHASFDADGAGPYDLREL